MKTKKINCLLKQAICQDIPYLLDSILKVPITKKEVFKMNTNLEKKISKKYLIIPALASISICCVVLIANVIIPNTKETLLSLDINPSIELSLNKQEKVVKCIAKNEDAKKIIGDMNFKNVEADIALNAIIGSLFQSGYLQKNTDENDILMSIDNKDKTKTKELEDKYTNVIKTTLKKSKISGTLLKQKDISNKNTKSLSEKYQISEGKASLIEKIVQKSPEANLDNLSTMNIKELVTYMSTNNLKLDDLDSEDIDDDDDVLDELNEIKEKEEDKIKEQQEIIQDNQDKVKENTEKEQDRLKEEQDKEKERIKKQQERIKEEQEKQQDKIKEQQEKLKEQKQKEQDRLKEQQQKQQDKIKEQQEKLKEQQEKLIEEQENNT